MVRKEATRCRYCQSDLPETIEPNMRPFEPRVIRSTDPELNSYGFKANMELIDQRAEILCEEISRVLKLDLEDPHVRTRIREMVNADPSPLTMMEKGILLQNILDELFGFGPLGPILRDPSVRDIYVYGPSQVHVSRVRRGIDKTDVVFKSDEHLCAVIERIFKNCGARLTKNAALNSCTLPNGTVVIAVFSDRGSGKQEAMLVIRETRTE